MHTRFVSHYTRDTNVICICNRAAHAYATTRVRYRSSRGDNCHTYTTKLRCERDARSLAFLCISSVPSASRCYPFRSCFPASAFLSAISPGLYTCIGNTLGNVLRACARINKTTVISARALFSLCRGKARFTRFNIGSLNEIPKEFPSLGAEKRGFYNFPRALREIPLRDGERGARRKSYAPHADASIRKRRIRRPVCCIEFR